MQPLNALHALLANWDPSVQLLDSNLGIEKQKTSLFKKPQKIDPKIVIARNIHTIHEYLRNNRFFETQYTVSDLEALSTLFGRIVAKCPAKIDWDREVDFCTLGTKILLASLQQEQDSSIERNIPVSLIVRIFERSKEDEQPSLFKYVFSHLVRHKDEHTLSVDQRVTDCIDTLFIRSLTAGGKIDTIELPTGLILHPNAQQKKVLPKTQEELTQEELFDFRKQLFFETVEASKKGYFCRGKFITLNPATVTKMQQGTKVLSLDMLKPTKSPKVETTFLVEDIDTLDLMQRLIKEGHNPVGLNMANKDHAGGAVEIGAPAQEESLFRRTNYCQALYLKENPHLQAQLPNGYHIPEHGLIYSPDVQIIRTSEKEGSEWCEPCSVSLIAAAAYDLRPAGDALSPKEVRAGLAKKVCALLRCAKLYNHNAVVLGAWGCGAFENDPQLVAETIKEVLQEKEFKGAFSVVAFPILQVPYNRQNNLEIFRKAFL
ncbi:MAG: TIGR02452 family protein [Verrucomicrobia bacterium]|nr:TIGR02452 family protein [Verrucomicrobiota bacterium]MBS0636865.1 TIGR02452 family protein [Verrucomicrobiota bacterium]